MLWLTSRQVEVAEALLSLATLVSALLPHHPKGASPARSLRVGPPGRCLCIGGSNQRALLYNWEGELLGALLQTQSSVAAIGPHPLHDAQALVLSADGEAILLRLVYALVEAHDRDRYAYRHAFLFMPCVVHALPV